VKLVLETTQKLYLEIKSCGDGDLTVTTVIDGLEKVEVVDAHTEGLDFYNTSKVLVGKLRFIE